MNLPRHRRGKRRTPKIVQQQVQMVWEAFNDALSEPLLRGLWHHLCHELAKEFGVPYPLESHFLKTLSDLQARHPLTDWRTAELMAELMQQWALPVAQALGPDLRNWILSAAVAEVTGTWPDDLSVGLVRLLPGNPLWVCRQLPSTIHGFETARREHYDQLMEALRAQRGEAAPSGRRPWSGGRFKDAEDFEATVIRDLRALGAGGRDETQLELARLWYQSDGHPTAEVDSLVAYIKKACRNSGSSWEKLVEQARS